MTKFTIFAALAMVAAACSSAPEPGTAVQVSRSALSAADICSCPTCFPNVLSIKDAFGAQGDGVADDYNAMVAGAKWISTASAGSVLVYPQGNYRIARVSSMTHPDADASCTRIPSGQPYCYGADVKYDHPSNVRIQGCQARILLDGNFYQAADNVTGYADACEEGGPIPCNTIPNAWNSTLSSVTPFVFWLGSNFVFDGFEINGNAQDTTRSSSVGESGGAGVVTAGCQGYVLSNLLVHHMQMDGVMIGIGPADKPAPGEGDGVHDVIRLDSAFTVDHVSSQHNGRSALTIMYARNGSFTNLDLGSTGDVAPTYNGFAPRSGVDIEPDMAPGFIESWNAYLLQKSGDFVFDSLYSHDNRGFAFAAAYGETTEAVTIQNSTLISFIDGWPTSQVIFGINGGLIQDTYIDTKGGHVLYGFRAPSDPYYSPTSMKILRTKVYSAAEGIYVTAGSEPITIASSQFFGQQPSSFVGHFPEFLGNSGASISDTSFAYPSGWIGDGTVGHLDVASSTRNTFSSNNTRPGVTCIQYGPTTAVSGDMFPSASLQPCP